MPEAGYSGDWKACLIRGAQIGVRTKCGNRNILGVYIHGARCLVERPLRRRTEGICKCFFVNIEEQLRCE
jgi:hypothetical protein